MSFLAEIKRRKVFKVAAVYAVAAWLIIQVVGQISDPLGLPSWFETFVIVLLGIGFPIALILGWIFDLTPDGLKSTPLEAAEAARSHAGQRFTYVVQVLVLLAVGFLVVDQYLIDAETIDSSPRVDENMASEFVNRFALTIGADLPIEDNRWNVLSFAQNGRRFVFQSDTGLYVRDFDSLESRYIDGSENIFSNPVLSRDGQYVAYYSLNGTIVRVSVDGGEPRDVTPRIVGISGASWTSDDSIIFAEDDGAISIVPANGGTPRLLINAMEGFDHSNPVLLPDGDSVMFSRRTPGDDWDSGEIVIHSISTGEEKVVVFGGSDARYLETGHIVFLIGNRLYGIAFDLATLSVSGNSVEVADGVTRALATGSGNYGTSTDGTLVFASRLSERWSTLVWLDRDGVEQSINGVIPGNYWYAQLSPDESMVALNGWEGTNTRRVWIHDLVRSVTRRLPVDLNQVSVAIWSPDSRVAYTGDGRVIWQRADGVGAPEDVHRAADGIGTVPSGFTPDGTSLLIMNAPPPRSTWLVDVAEPDGQAVPILQGPYSQYNATVSPDGKWMAYQSNESGSLEVYVQTFPPTESGGKWQISSSGGELPVWSSDPEAYELFFLEPDPAEPEFSAVMAVSVEVDGEEIFSYSPPRELFRRNIRSPVSSFHAPYDVTRDGSRFITMSEAPLDDATRGTSEIVIVQNWFDEVRSLVPAGN